MKLVKATAVDIPTIQKLAHAIWPPTFSEILSKEQLNYMLQMMYSEEALYQQLEQGIIFLLAIEEEKAIGFVAYELNYKDAAEVKIHKLYLLPTTQGKGYGKRMIDEVASIGKSHAQKSISLNVNRYNKAYDFYLKIGFDKIGEEDIDIGQGFLMEDAIMEKRL